jgi:HSP20 family protein
MKYQLKTSVNQKKQTIKGGMIMELARWTPRRNAWGLQNRMNRLFDDFFAPMTGTEEALFPRNWNPTADIYEEDEHYVIKAEVPGVDKNNIHINFENNVLVLKGERTENKEVKEESYYRREMATGTFQRSFALPEGIDADAIKADYKDGVIKITIPKPKSRQPKKISVH